MKKFFKVLIKILVFFFLWAVLGGLINIPSDNPAIWRFFAELAPFLLVAIDTLLFWLVEKREIPVIIGNSPAGNTILGITIGLAWVLLPAAVLYFMGVISFTGPDYPDMLWLWLISMFINTIMQELLVRGYMYQLIRKASANPGKLSVPKAEMMVRKISLMKSERINGKMVYTEIFSI